MGTVPPKTGGVIVGKKFLAVCALLAGTKFPFAYVFSAKFFTAISKKPLITKEATD